MARSNLETFRFTITYHPRRKQAWQCVAETVSVLGPMRSFKSNAAESALMLAIDWADGVM